MLAILDPVLFDPDAPVQPRSLDELALVLQKSRARIPDAAWYWDPLQRTLIRPLSRRPEYSQGLDRLREFVRHVPLPPLPPRVKVWSMRQMFDVLGEAWVTIMSRVISRAILTGEPTVLLTHLRERRNIVTRQGPGKSRLREKVCWNLRVQPRGESLQRVPAVCNRRNLRVPWTCRLDERLPSADVDRASFPFCPLDDWQKSSVDVVFTHESRPTWRDQKGNHWARPATGGGHHWDVYLEQSLVEEYGLGQLNIVQWGAPTGEGATGSIHHVPGGKKSRLRKETGWSC